LNIQPVFFSFDDSTADARGWPDQRVALGDITMRRGFERVRAMGWVRRGCWPRFQTDQDRSKSRLGIRKIRAMVKFNFREALKSNVTRREAAQTVSTIRTGTFIGVRNA